MPPQTTRPPFLTAASAAGTSAPREDDGGVEFFRRHLVGTAGPHRAERPREVLRRRVARACEGKHPPALPGCDLGQNVGGGAEAIEPERFALPRHAIAEPADQAGAEQRRGFGCIEVFGQRE
jgi:hypothetical protein